jgi:hypothetical protein
MYTDSLGPWAEKAFLIGAVVVLFSTLLAALAAWTRLFSDAFGRFGWIDFNDEKQRRKSIAILSVIFPYYLEHPLLPDRKARLHGDYRRGSHHDHFVNRSLRSYYHALQVASSGTQTITRFRPCPLAKYRSDRGSRNRFGDQVFCRVTETLNWNR